MILDFVNGEQKLYCIILSRGFVPFLPGVRCPSLIPRPFNIKEVRILLALGIDLRVVDSELNIISLEDALNIPKLNEDILNQMLNTNDIETSVEINIEAPVEIVENIQEVVEEVIPEPVVMEEPKVTKEKQEKEKPVTKESTINENVKEEVKKETSNKKQNNKKSNKK